MTYNLIATAAFGLEATVKREITRMGYEITSSQNGRVDFAGDETAIINANIRLGAADRVLLKIGEFEALTFDSLFEQTKALPWSDIIPKDGQFTVTGKSVKSRLHSVPDCQAIVKKAVVESMKKKYKTDRFEETGAAYTIQTALYKDTATLTIDTTGAGLNKRGYRYMKLSAPIKETLAYALIELSYWRKDRILFDPFCGSGTIAIEAAMMARNIPPGLNRRFASEGWDIIPKALWNKVREERRGLIDKTIKTRIFASDIDPAAIQTAILCAKNAGVADCILFECKDIKNAVLPGEYGVLITNPPYGGRMMTGDESEKLYKTLGKTAAADKTWSVYVITACEEFESLYGKKADAKRKLFNGNVKTDYYQFYGQKPPKGYSYRTHMPDTAHC